MSHSGAACSLVIVFLLPFLHWLIELFKTLICIRMRSSLVAAEIYLSGGWDLAQLRMKFSRVAERSSRVVRASGCLCQSRNSPGFWSHHPPTQGNLRGLHIKQCWIMCKKGINPKIPLFKNSHLINWFAHTAERPAAWWRCSCCTDCIDWFKTLILMRMSSSWVADEIKPSCGWDLTEWLECLAVNAKVATVLGLIPAFAWDSGTWGAAEIKQCWITYIKKEKRKKSPF